MNDHTAPPKDSPGDTRPAAPEPTAAALEHFAQDIDLLSRLALAPAPTRRTRGRRPVMNDATTTILGAVLTAAAAALAAIHDVGVLQDVLVGAGAGVFISRLLQARLERRSGRELDATRIRQLDATWITACVRGRPRHRRSTGATVMTMRSTLLIAVALIAVGITAAVIGNALQFSGGAWLASMLVGVFLVSLVDRERFYGEPHPFRRPPRR